VDEIEEREEEDPDQVDDVPVQATSVNCREILA
jgi:hypothetical protein